MRYPFDAIIIHGGGLQKIGRKYYPTDYRHGDQFGMLGGGIRVAAALELYFQRQAKEFVFTTGITEKNKSLYGPDIATEASVYADKFLRCIESLKKRSVLFDNAPDLEEPVITREDRSCRTLTNVKEVLTIIRTNKSTRISVVSNSYHIPRLEALYREVMKQEGMDISIEFKHAEEILKLGKPGMYDIVIDRAYKTEQAKVRIANETNGVRDLSCGNYAAQEFQLLKTLR